MNVVFQEFVLVTPKKVGEDSEGILQGIVKAQLKWDALRRELINKGYIILFVNEHFCGIPRRVIVGPAVPVSSSAMIKEDFYRISEELGLPFESGVYYVEEEQTARVS